MTTDTMLYQPRPSVPVADTARLAQATALVRARNSGYDHRDRRDRRGSRRAGGRVRRGRD